MVEKNLSWFRKLLEHTLPAENEQGGEGLEIVISNKSHCLFYFFKYMLVFIGI